ncbi:transketolase [Paramaledivibacter caminithermalis]|jgi:transketolase|uniref:Transketolase subunit A n=1 Tax=Paramaledivibacter caminithermalis (strain DSM 15212 / CIP 107654 / DViRD3) TaxID=1121301 RepID=A0A1M6KT15_PARC5|nr:transketolase [Paramaledivibacter caminithermalis]SHJ62020.1 transketolase subunit A [Paramaledivibacter caminithermalis DSM 15212]
MKVQYKELEKKATQIRKDIIEMINAAGSGHPGGSLSAADILTVLYFERMNIDPQNIKLENRDKFVLSKGHAAPVLYAALARRGFFSPDELLNLRKAGSMLQGHPDMKGIPGVEMSTGSLGQGFSTSIGMALASKLDKKDNRIYVLLGDGEINEGLVWEAAMAAAHYKLDNLTAILDYNGLQIDGKNEDVMSTKPIDEKWRSFGWNVIEIDGHNFEEIINAFNEAERVKEKPTMIIAKTIKGKGVSFMENEVSWHGTAPKDEDKEKALKELGGEQ